VAVPSQFDESLAELAQVSRWAWVLRMLRALLLGPDPAAILRRRQALVDEIKHEMPKLPAVPGNTGSEPPEALLIPEARYKQAAELPVDERLIAVGPWCWSMLGLAALPWVRLRLPVVRASSSAPPAGSSRSLCSGIRDRATQPSSP
jgi:hypothetical protein